MVVLVAVMVVRIVALLVVVKLTEKHETDNTTHMIIVVP